MHKEIDIENIEKIMPVEKLLEYLAIFDGEYQKELESQKDSSWEDDVELTILDSVKYGKISPEGDYDVLVEKASVGIYNKSALLYYFPAILANFPYYGGDKELGVWTFDGQYDEHFIDCVVMVYEFPEYMDYLKHIVFDKLILCFDNREKLYSYDISPDLTNILRSPEATGKDGWMERFFHSLFFIKSYLFLLNDYPEKVDMLLNYVGFDEPENIARIKLSIEILFFFLFAGWEPEDLEISNRLFRKINVDSMAQYDLHERYSEYAYLQLAILFISRALPEKKIPCIPQIINKIDAYYYYPINMKILDAGDIYVQSIVAERKSRL